jgi:phosphoribosylanthranilate isomerase
LPLDVLQLHGEEPPEYCHGYPSGSSNFRVRDSSSIQTMASYPDVHVSCWIPMTRRLPVAAAAPSAGICP